MLKRAFLATALAALSLSARLHAAPAGLLDFDPSVLAESGSDLLKRAPPAQMDAVNKYLAHAWNGTVWLRPWTGTLHDPALFQR